MGKVSRKKKITLPMISDYFRHQYTIPSLIMGGFTKEEAKEMMREKK